MDKVHSRRSRELYNKRKRKQSTYSNQSSSHSEPCKKRKNRRHIRHRLANASHKSSQSASNTSSLKFGAINVDGLTLQNYGEIEDLLTQRDFDVSRIYSSKA